ncbi:MAG: class I SAM-dependent methyltransferase [Defluviitaleaceae bacterium]|nr:class I SAM-dependent methyltransferase [Defluviitaleaceae bacterium]
MTPLRALWFTKHFVENCDANKDYEAFYEPDEMVAYMLSKTGSWESKSVIKDNLRKFYNQEAQYRNVSEKQDWKQAERQHFLSLAQSEGKETLLELGAGAGYDSLFFQENGMTVIAVDLSAEMVKHCQAKGINAHELDFYHLGELGEKYQCIWAMNSLLHVPKADLPRVLANIDAVLEAGGLFYMGVYGGVDSEHDHTNELSDHPRFFAFYTKETLLKALAAHFDVLAFEQTNVGRDVAFQSVIMRKKPVQPCK